MDRNQLLFAMGVIKGMLASATDEDVKMSLNVSLEFIAKALQGYEMCPPVEPDRPEETVEDYLPKEIDKEDE